jgi:hypothetical protein
MKLGVYDDVYQYRLLFISRIADEAKARARLQSIPDTWADGFSINKISNMYVGTTYVSTTIYNADTITKYVTIGNGTSGVFEIKPEGRLETAETGAIHLRQSENLTQLSYNDLSHVEREKYIPKDILTGAYGARISAKALYDWVLSSDHAKQYNLKYIETRDKDYHMEDMNTGLRYRYNIDTFRALIPFLVRGTLNAVMVAKLTGSHQLRIVLTPVKLVTEYDICLDEGSEDETS